VNASVGQDGHGEGTQELEQEPADPQPRVRHTEPCGHRLLRGYGLRDRLHGAGRWRRPGAVRTYDFRLDLPLT